MKRISWNHHWQVKPDVEGPFDMLFGGGGQGREVTLPHDSMIEEPRDPNVASGGQCGFYPCKSYSYLKTFQAPEEWKEKTIMVEFEGIMRRAMVYLNGAFLGGNSNGYSGFRVRLDPFLRYGQENTLKVLAVNEEKTSRWYPGSGIYRDVWLLEGGSTYFVPAKQRITTISLEDGYALMELQGQVWNSAKQPAALRILAELLDPQGNLAAKGVCFCTIGAESRGSWHTRLTVDSPALWSVEAPQLYTCRMSLLDCETEIDAWESPFGIRTLALDARHGLRINGKNVKLRGACIHHDNGIIGAASFPDAERFRMKNLKAAGFNAIRSSHHPAGPALLRACDEVGILVMDEFSDMWNEPMNHGDWSLDFAAHWQEDLERMVDKDYNHPSAVLFSTGNEIPEIGRASGADLNRQIAEAMHRLDPTRFSTFGLNGFLAVSDVMDELQKVHESFQPAQEEPDEAMGGAEGLNKIMGGAEQARMDSFSVSDTLTNHVEAAASAVDVVGYNYLTARHELEHKNHPDRVVVGSETYPPEIPRLWDIVERNSHVIGDFTWTGYDYLGEAGIGIPHYDNAKGLQGRYPDQLAYCGDVDLNACRRPVSYLREIAFGLSRGPYIAVDRPEHFGQKFDMNHWKYADCLSSWTFPGFEGKPVWVRVLARCEEVDLLINGESLGRAKVGEIEALTAIFRTEYHPGKLEAVAYTDGKVIGRTELETAGPATRLRVSADRECLTADDQSLAFVTVDLTDREGRWNRGEKKTVTVSIEGPGVLQGFGSAAPSTEGSYQDTSWDTWDGRVMAVVRSTAEPGDITLRFTAPRCEEAVITLPSRKD